MNPNMVTGENESTNVGDVTPRRMEQLQAEALATTASAFDVGVIEDELGGQLVLDKVHFSPKKRQLSLPIDEYLDAVLIHHLVEFGLF